MISTSRAEWGKIWSSLIRGDVKTKLLFIGAVVLFIILLGMAVAFFIFNLPPGEALWWSWTHVLDSGSIGDDKDSLSRRIIGSIIVLVSVVLFGGAFITLSEEAARSAMDRLMQGSVKKGISGHTIIAGRGTKLKAFISSPKLQNLDKNEKLLVVVPDQEALVEARNEQEDNKNICFVVDQIWEDKKCRLGLAVAKRILLLDNFGGDTGDMLKTIAKIRQMRKETGNQKRLILYAEVNDRTLANGLRMTIDEIKGNDPTIDIHILNICDASARLALQHHPLDSKPISSNIPVVTLVIEGWTPFAQALFWQAIRVAHYPSKPTRIIVIHRHADDIKTEVRAMAPGLWDPWCIQHLVEIKFADQLSLKESNLSSKDIVTVAVCFDDADKSFSKALQYRDVKQTGLEQVFVELPDTSGYREAIKFMGSSNGKIPLYPVGASAQAFELAEELDELAEKIHSHYQIKYNDVEWLKLDEVKRAWNRSPADHIYVKKRILSAMLENDDKKQSKDDLEKNLKKLINRLADYDPSNPDRSLDKYFDMLSRIEHDRWCAEKYADGWTHKEGPKNNAEKHNPCLIPYDDLPSDEKSKDWETMKVIFDHIKQDNG